MPIKTGGGLETMSLVLTQDQAQRLRQRRDEQANSFRRITLSDVAREVVEIGLRSFALPENTAIDGTDKDVAMAMAS